MMSTIYSEGLVLLLSRWGKRWVIITDDTVGELFGNRLRDFLRDHHFLVHILSFPPGEESKCREVKASLEDQMFEQGCNKDWGVIALGGGVVMDVAGYVAATFCRGIPLVNIPTTLLGMVDASWGGKNGVNLPWGKNLIGTLYFPKEVVIDRTLLQGLPHLHGGLEETIKHALIADPLLFEFLKANKDAILSRDDSALKTLIEKSCCVKQKILEEDLDESKDIRMLLNFGHTVGHAIEGLCDYTVSHGDAIAIGMRVESRLALDMGRLSKEAFEKILELFDMYDLAAEMPRAFDAEMLWHYMCRDKKARGGQVRIVILNAIGQAACTFLDKQIWEESFYGQVMCQP